MNTFFRTCVYICIGIIIFTLCINVANGLMEDFYPMTLEGGSSGINQSNALSKVTGLDNPNMNNLWLLAIGVGLAIGGIWSYLARSVTPIGVVLFSEVFWTSWIRMQNILSMGDWLNGDIILVFTVVVMMLFIAAVIGMLTGSG